MERPESPEIAGVRAQAEALRATFERMTAEAPAIHAKARALEVTEKSRDGLISVTVGARGDLVRLDIDPRIYRRPDSRALADTITETVHLAAMKAQERVIELFEPLVPADQMRMHLDGDLDGVMEQMAAQMLGKE